MAIEKKWNVDETMFMYQNNKVWRYKDMFVHNVNVNVVVDVLVKFKSQQFDNKIL
jgi:hypothetical protein